MLSKANTAKPRSPAAPAGRAELSRSLEDYLEAILDASAQAGVARVRDIARRAGVGKSAVTAALRVLAQRELVDYGPYRLVTLTPAGRKAAGEVNRRHTVIRRFLTQVVGIAPGAAEANACRIEHVIDRALWERLKRIMEFAAARPAPARRWAKALETYCKE
jgi:DtxR family Mn-dependent transcriptional regulator